MRRDAAAQWIAPALTLAAAGLSLVLVPGSRGFMGAALALLMGAIAIADLRHFLIPNAATAPAFLLGLAASVLRDLPSIAGPMALAALRGLLLALLFLLLREIHRRWRGREGIGLGDVKLAAVAGAWLDWLTIPLVVELAAVAALATYFFFWLTRRRVVSGGSRVPFGLFLAPAIWAGWLFEAWVPAMY